MATYYDALNDFYKSNENEPLTSSAQLLYLHLLHMNNRLGRSGHVQVSDRELERVTQLSRPTVTDAKRRLKNRGLIDFKTDGKNPRAGTNYELLFFGKVSQSLSQSLSQSENVPIYAHAKSKEQELRVENLEAADAHAHALVDRNVKTIEVMDVHDLWFYEFGWQLRGSVGLELEQLEQKHGRDAVHRAIIETVKAAPKSPFNYFKAVLKGGDNRGKDVATGGRAKVVALKQRTYELPKRTGDEPWLKY